MLSNGHSDHYTLPGGMNAVSLIDGLIRSGGAVGGAMGVARGISQETRRIAGSRLWNRVISHPRSTSTVRFDPLEFI